MEPSAADPSREDSLKKTGEIEDLQQHSKIPGSANVLPGDENHDINSSIHTDQRRNRSRNGSEGERMLKLAADSHPDVGNTALSMVASLPLTPPVKKVDVVKVESRESRDKLNRQKEMEEMRARTMYNMCDIIKASDMTRRIIFLTNSQASVFEESNIKKLIDAFDVDPPKLLIRIVMSTNGRESIKSSIPYILLKKPDLIKSGRWREFVQDVRKDIFPVPSFAKDEDSVQSERKIEAFVHDVLLPLLVKTRAFVLVPSTRACTLGMCIGKAANFIASRYGGVLPFTLLAMDVAYRYVENCYDSGDGSPSHLSSTTFKFFSNCPSWRDRFEVLKEAVQAEQNASADQNKKEIPPIERVYQDLNPYIANLLMVDGVREDENTGEIVGTSSESLERLQSLITNHLTVYLPCVAIGTHRMGENWTQIASLVDKGVPVVFLDSRVRAPIVAEHVLDAEGAVDKVKTAEQLLKLAIENDTKTWEEIFQAGRLDCLDSSRLAYLSKIKHLLLEILAARQSSTDTAIDINVTDEPEAVTSIFQAINAAKQTMDSALTQLPNEFMFTLVAHVVETQSKSCWEAMTQERQEKRRSQGVNDWRDWDESQLMVNFTFVQLILKSPCFYGFQVDDSEEIRALLENIVTKDRLPSAEELEGLHVLRFAWDVIDVGSRNVVYYKILSKILYLFVLLSGLTTVILVALKDDIDRGSAEIDPNMTPSGSLVFYLACATTFVTGYNAYANPTGRWQQIRNACCALESVIFQYRCRTGPFRMNNNFPNRPTEALLQHVLETKESFLTSSDVATTDWSRQYPPSVFKHGQYKPIELPGRSKNNKSGAVHDLADFDDHFSPLKPERFNKYRLRTMIELYKQRLPTYSQKRNIFSILVMLATMAGTILAYRGYTPLVAICTSATAAITSWMQYTNIMAKVGRYNQSITNLENLLLWWQSLSVVDKSSILNVDKLVTEAEQIINSERAAWFSAPAKKKDAKEDGEEGGEKESTKDK